MAMTSCSCYFDMPSVVLYWGYNTVLLDKWQLQKHYYSHVVLTLASSAVLSVAILAVFSACVFVISRNLQKILLGVQGKTSVSAVKQILQPYVGESLYIAILGVFFSCLAAAFSLRSQPETAAALTSTRAYAVIEESVDTEPLIGGAEREELIREASPD